MEDWNPSTRDAACAPTTPPLPRSWQLRPCSPFCCPHLPRGSPSDSCPGTVLHPYLWRSRFGASARLPAAPCQRGGGAETPPELLQLALPAPLLSVAASMRQVGGSASAAQLLLAGILRKISCSAAHRRQLTGGTFMADGRAPAQPDHDLEKHDLLDIFYSGLTIESRAYLDSCAGCVFRKRTPDDAEELLAKIGRNHDDWSTPEPTPTPIVKKRGMIKLNDEDMREAKKSLKEKGIKPEDVKNLPPIEDICETIPPSSMIEYMKDIVTNKRKVPNEEISTMLANYSFNGKIPKKLGDPGAVIDCNKGMVTFNVDDKEHTVYFPKRIDKKGKMKKFKFGELFKKATTSTGRPSRASTQIRRSYNEDVIAPSFAPEEDHGAPNASSFPCYEFLTNAGILDDFFTLVNRAGLATYVGDERGQYYRLTKIFVESFKFHNTEYEPTVAFKIYDIPVTMKLEEFCFALGIAPVGTARRIDDNPRDLLELYRGITGDDCRTIQRGKIRNIQLPAIKYFAYYISTSILGRENTSNISSYHLAFLNVALTGETPYHLGSLIARRLSSRGPIFGGTIASRILTHLDIPLDSNDVPLTPRKLDIAAMKSHHFVTTNSTIDNIVYKMLFADGNEKEIPLPQQGLFNIDRQSWSLTKEVVEEHMKIQEFHQQHDSENAEPSYDYTVTYPDVSSSTYMEPGRSSSYYEDTTSWGPWE
ncbi:hypothetical protein QYE76_038951 [Lolium multiflorum]|uniref:Arabidopsis retrotransposon Orf1 C-terminal domain-containing protein n=1 Tax=Lolium multiflorum TaxID=4521 RepID=A0AAD8T9X9_LOLMU|nr:hypothetical protein QYE76_038951 [Lolium multiflorum]